MNRIKPNDQILDSLARMSGSYHGIFNLSMNVLLATVKYGAKIDPNNKQGPLGAVINMDAAQIFDEKITSLYKMCGEDLVKTVACVRAHQLQMISYEALHAAIAGEIKLNVDDVLANVQKVLPEFGKFQPAPL